MEAKLFDDGFWSVEREKLLSLLLPLIIRAVLGGAREAMDGLRVVGIGLDWQLVNTAARKWAEEYSFALVKGITETSRDFLRGKVGDWIGSGKPLRELVTELEPMWGRVRAEMIGATETTRAFAQGNLVAWRESGMVAKKRWSTVSDPQVCEICEPLDGQEIDLDDEIGFAGVGAPPAHVNCRCYIQPVLMEVR